MTSFNSFQQALDDITARSAGGAPFLFAYGITFVCTAILSFFVSKSTAALVAMFQGSVALPLAFWLERQLRCQTASIKRPSNPLDALSAQLAMSQVLGLPALIVANSLNPGAIPVLLSSLSGMHLFPYAWLHRTRVYLWLAIATSIGGFVLQLALGSSAFSYILLYVGVLYLAAAPIRNGLTFKIIRSIRS